MKPYFSLVALLFLTGPSAFARVAILGGADYSLYSNSSTIGTSSVDVKGGLGYGGGLVFDFGKFESGVIYRKYAINTTTTTSGSSIAAATHTSLLEVPALYRLGSGNNTLGLGGFYELVLGTGGGSNYGLTAGPRFATTNGLFFDLRLNYSFKSGSPKHLIGMIGYYF